MKTIGTMAETAVMMPLQEDKIAKDDEYFFEGTEKLLEIWFASSSTLNSRCSGGGHGDVGDLRRIER